MSRHIQHHLEVLLDRPNVAELHIGEGETVYDLRIPGIGLIGAVQVVACRVSPSWPKITPRFLRVTGFLGSATKVMQA